MERTDSMGERMHDGSVFLIVKSTVLYNHHILRLERWLGG